MTDTDSYLSGNGWTLSVSREVIRASQFLTDFLQCDDDGNNIPVMVGNIDSPDETLCAIHKLTKLNEFVEMLEQFHHPPTDVTAEHLQQILVGIHTIYQQWKTYPHNQVYYWLFPINIFTRQINAYEKGTSPAGYYQFVYEGGITFLDNADDLRDVFIDECGTGNEVVLKWLYSLGRIDIHTLDECPFITACYYEHLSVAKWLLSLGGINIHIRNNKVFEDACYYGHLAIAQWIYSIAGDGIDIHYNRDYYFRMACCFGHEDVARWLYSLGGVDIHAGYTIRDTNYSFVSACYSGHLGVARWLYSLGKDKIDIHDKDDRLIHITQRNGKYDVVEWLKTLP